MNLLVLVLVLVIVIVIDSNPLYLPAHIRPSSSRRGSSLLAMLGLAIVLAACCSLILDRSFEATRAGAMMTWRLQCRAAAEGVAVMLLEDPAHPPAPQTLGTATVTCGTPAPAGDRQLVVPMDVALHFPGSTTVRWAMRYQARCVQTGNRWQLQRLEE